MNESTRHSGLHQKIDRLDEPEIVVVDRFVDAILTSVEQELTSGSWLTTKFWADAFSARLRAHHALNVEPLSTVAFEAAFNAACVAAGWTTIPADSATNRFFDTIVSIPEGRTIKLSLKATSAKNLRPNYVHISKLTEAAWIQDTRKEQDRYEKIIELFSQYRNQTDSIFILRCFRKNDSSLFYQLVELPTKVFEPVDHLTRAQAQAGTIPIPPDSDKPNFSIRIDRSDAKITVTGIRIETCKIHGTWTIPKLSEAEPDS